MEQPQYHLQNVVHAKQTLEDFDGPLDVILLLLSKNKIEIQDISFSVGSGYMPVTKAANNMDTIKAAGLTLSPVVEQVLTGAVATINENRLYTPLAFEGGQAARKVLEYALSDKAAADRAIVVERIAAGMSAEEAEAEFLTDECFDSWYQETLTKLQAYE